MPAFDVPTALAVAGAAGAGWLSGYLLGRAVVAACTAAVRRLRRAEARAAVVPEWAPRTPLEQFMAAPPAAAEMTRRAAA